MNPTPFSTRTRHVALFPWGGVVEDFLDHIGLDRRTFAEEASGGWMFGYAEALRRQGVATTIMCFSAELRRPERRRNPVTGMTTLFLPPSGLYRLLRRWPGDTDDVLRRKLWLRAQPLQDLVRYFATPVATVAAALRAEGCTTVLTQEYENPRCDVLVRVGRRLGIPVYASFQGAPSASRVEMPIRRRTLRAAAGLIIPSGREAARVRRTYGVPSERIAVIPNPIDVDLWRPEPRAACREALGLPATAEIVVCHGRIDVHRKGLDLLLDAWRGLTSAAPGRDLRLHLIGSGQDDARLEEELARAPVPGLRWVRRYVSDRSEIRRELGAADVYVLPSRHEGFPVAPLEALACGLPIVAADAPGIAEILPRGEADGGIVVPTGNAAALRRGIERLLAETELRARLAARARGRVAEFCSLDAVGSRLAAFLT